MTTDVAGRPGSIEREALMAKMKPAERCVNRILDQAIRAVRFEAPEEETYREALLVVLLIVAPLGIWKAVELIVWMFTHVRVTW